MGISNGRNALSTFLLCAATAIATHAQSFTTLASFNGANGVNPLYTTLVQGLDGGLYGTTATGGTYSNGGVVFEVTPSGTLTTVFSVDGYSTGAIPQFGVALGADGSIYLSNDQTDGPGQIVQSYLTHGGAWGYFFCSQPNCADGSYPVGALIQAANGSLYGATHQGGTFGAGTLFKITTKGALTTLYSFCRETTDCDDGAYPWAGLVQAGSGNFYGTTYSGGANMLGTVFRVTPSGELTTLYSFCSEANCTDGAEPRGGLVEGPDGSLYGTTTFGGANGHTNYGTIFKISPEGALTTLYSFCSRTGCSDGAKPYAGLTLGTDGNFYGTTYYGGRTNEHGYGYGTIFEITPGGAFTTLHTFCTAAGCHDGSNPAGGLAQRTDGTFYGTTNSGGTSGDGTVFSLSVGLGSFVKALPTSGKIGGTVQILGTNLTGATKVAFHGIAAVFTVVSSTQITATVPAGATTGEVEVMTSSGVVVSNVRFVVLP